MATDGKKTPAPRLACPACPLPAKLNSARKESLDLLKKRGVFITLEGIDGTGKSTHLRLLANWLRRRGWKIRTTREPGGTRAGEQIRRILLASGSRKLTPLAELALMYAARHEHLEEVVRPALARGEIVISDRFNDASLAYQGYGRQLGERPVRLMDDLFCGPTQPDLTIILDAGPELALRRTVTRKDNLKQRRFEDAGLKFYERVRKGYREIARREPWRVKLVRAGRPLQEVQAEIREITGEFLARTGL